LAVDVRVRRRKVRSRWIIAAVLAALLAVPLSSYVSTMLQPSSLPLSVRSVEWLRQHHGNWLVDHVETFYYGWWRAPAKGGAQLKALPAVGAAALRRPARTRRPASPWPRPITPVFSRPLAGEGIWRSVGPLIGGKPPVLVTTFRTEVAYPRIVAYVAWFDHRRTALAWYPGRYEPPSAPLRGPAEIPYGERWRLLATFNGGFTHIDGNNGSAVDGMTYEPLQDGLATLIGYRDGRVAIENWHGGPTPGADVAFARQSLAPILWNGKLNPALNDGPQWGYTLGNAVRVWRTGVGIDRRGNIIYAAADYQTVTTLARILQRAGAVRAMQFDINPEWPSLITYGHHNGIHPTKVVPNVQQSAWRYLVADDRDFVAVYRRLPGPVTVPFK
jgi:phosphodiester glycosidase